MQHTKIEWIKNEDGTQGYSINPVKGLCPVACSYCYARGMYKRFKWNPEIRYDPYVFLDLPHKPSKVFVGSTIELFHESTIKYMYEILRCIQVFKKHTFIFLTKKPENLIKFSPFPSNCYVGVSVTDYFEDKPSPLSKALFYLRDIKATVKFLSFEPLLSWVTYGNYRLQYDLKESGISWIIIGQQTPISSKTVPQMEWIREIIDAADKAKIPVFLKNNLKFPCGLPLRQGLPKKEMFESKSKGGDRNGAM